MVDRPDRARLTSAEIDPDPVTATVLSHADGALVEFRGIVRDHDHGRTVVRLEYEAHPSAAARLEAAVAAVESRHPGVALAVVHRIGALRVGDLALLCAAASAHRSAAFAACSELVDEVKASVPIWKRQTFADGTDEWVGIAG